MKHLYSTSLKFLFFIFLSSGFRGMAQQAMITITPNSGTPGRTIDIVVRGVNTHFNNGVSVIDFGMDIQVLKFVVSNPETGIASISIASGAGTGFRNVKVTTGTETAEITNGFEVFVGGGNFRASLELLPFQSGALSDFDISKPQTQPILFFANMYNDNTARMIKMYMTFFTGDGTELFTLYTDKIAIAAMQVMRLTNRDLNNFKVKKPEGNIFLQEVTNKGAIPPGDYIYKLLVTDENGLEIGSDQSRTTVTNPMTNPELISPGANFNTPIQEVYTAFPVFQWFGQADKFDFAVYEVIKGQTPEDVVKNVKVFQQEDLKAKSLIYPTYAEKLVEGKIYAWQINAKVVTSKGIQKVPSEVFRFQYTDPTKVSGELKNISKVTVMPQQLELKPGATYKFTAVIYDQENKIITSVFPVWKVVPAKGSVDKDGYFTAPSADGTYAIVAQVGAFQDYATVVVKTPKVIQQQNTDDWMINLMLKQLFGLPN